MASTYTPIATTTLGSATASYTFSSIPSTYTDLVLVMGSLGINNAASAGKLQFNGDTGSNYSVTFMYGNGSSVGSSRNTSQTDMRIYGWQAGNVANSNNDNVIINIQNYANTTTYKTAITRSNLPQNETASAVGLWRSTAAINSITLRTYNGTDLWTAGSTFTLYGIKAA